VQIHAYCLMDNHYHLLVKTPRGNLSRVMRHINGIYTQKFNRHEKTDGPLFRGRYKAIIVDGDSYLLQVSRYIHLNPRDIKTVSIDKYRWSSYLHYLKPKHKTSWLSVDEILSMFSNKKNSFTYRQFVASGLDDETENFYNRDNIPVIFGEKEQKKKLLKKISAIKIKHSSSSDYKRTIELPTPEKIIYACAKFFNVKEESICQSFRGKINMPRKIAIYGCRMWASEKLSSIAGVFRCTNHSTISNTVKQIEERLKQDKKLASIARKIQKSLLS
jgi:putative transposase